MTVQKTFKVTAKEIKIPHKNIFQNKQHPSLHYACHAGRFQDKLCAKSHIHKGVPELGCFNFFR